MNMPPPRRQPAIHSSEMHHLIYNKDWSNTSLGNRNYWPQSLQTTLSILLNSKFPMFLFWGEDLICFYNDAYRPSLGKNGKHPEILGMPGKEAWPETWPIIEPIIINVLEGVEAVMFEDLLIPIFRNDKMEDVYWTFSYSAVYGESKNPQGVFVTCVETTEKVIALSKLNESKDRLNFAIHAAELATWDVNPRTGVLSGDELLKKWHGFEDRETLDLDVGFSIVAEKDRAKLTAAFENAMMFSSGGTLDHTYTIINPKTNIPRTIRAKGKATFDENKIATRMNGIVQDVTEQVKAENEKQNFTALINVSNDFIGLINLDFAFTYINPAGLKLLGWNNCQGKNILDCIYHEDGSTASQLIKNIYANDNIHIDIRFYNASTGIPFWIKWNVFTIKTDLGNVECLGTVCTNITEHKLIQENLQSALLIADESEKQFRTAVNQAPMAIAILRGKDRIIKMANSAYLSIIDKKYEEVVGKPFYSIIPEIKNILQEIIEGVFTTGKPFYGYEFPIELTRFGKTDLSYFNFVYHPLKEDDGVINGIMVVGTEVTSMVKTRQSLETKEKQFRNLVMQSSVAMAIFSGPDFIIELANTQMFTHIWRKNEKDVIGKKLIDIFPELADQLFIPLLKEVYETGNPCRQFEKPALVIGDDGPRTFFLDFEFMPFPEQDGTLSKIMITANDVTERVDARKQVEIAEERLRLATEATEIATWDLDLTTREIFYSDRLSKIFGHDPKTVLTHQQLRDHIHRNDIDQVENAFKIALQNGLYKYEARVIKPDGTLSWISTHGKVIFNNEGKPVKMVGTMRDITDEKSHQQILEESEEKFRLLADSVPQHIWISDADGNINYYNQSIYNYTGLTHEEIKDNGWTKIIHPDDIEENVRRWHHSLDTGIDYFMEHRFKKADGEYRWHLSRAVAQKDTQGNIQMWVGTSTDIQDQKSFSNELEKQVLERTRELEQKNVDLEKMNKELQSFAYISSHDLQEPLRKIQTFSSRIMDKELNNLSPQGHDYFIRMQRSAIRMQTLIDDLLSYSRTNTAERKFETVDLNNIVREVQDDLREELQQSNAVIQKNELCIISIIKFQFRQLLHNLISNSLKFTADDRNPQIQITGHIDYGKNFSHNKLLPEERYCYIKYEDNGIGFEPEFSEKIFELFQRLHAKGQFKGTGIGLSIVKKIVENHNGCIYANGELNKGAIFHIYLPVVH